MNSITKMKKEVIISPDIYKTAEHIRQNTAILKRAEAMWKFWTKVRIAKEHIERQLND